MIFVLSTPVLVFFLALFMVILNSLGLNDPKFIGPNFTHQAIVAKEIKPVSAGPFEIRPSGEHSVVFLLDHKRFAKMTADEQHFALVINPDDVPAQYKGQVTRIDGDFESNILDDNDLLLTDKS